MHAIQELHVLYNRHFHLCVQVLNVYYEHGEQYIEEELSYAEEHLYEDLLARELPHINYGHQYEHGQSLRQTQVDNLRRAVTVVDQKAEVVHNEDVQVVYIALII